MWLGSAGSKEKSTSLMFDYVDFIWCARRRHFPQGRAAVASGQSLCESVCLGVFDWLIDCV